MNISAVVPVKGTSERIPSKNLRLLDGKPLFLHTLEALLNVDCVNSVYLDTEDEDIISLSAYLPNLQILRRPTHLATNSTDGNKLFAFEADNIDCDILIQRLCTSPFVKASSIEQTVKILCENQKVDSVIGVKTEKLYAWLEGEAQYDTSSIPNSVDLPGTTIETMGLYAMRRSDAVKMRRRIGSSPHLLELDSLEALDVNWPDDFELAHLVAAGKREKVRMNYKLLASYLSTPIFSDILDDLLCSSQVIRGLSSPIQNAKFIGRAKTLHLRVIEEGEDFRGIYDALNHYETVVPGDVLVVQNDCYNYAYFGQLNASLAIRRGVVGVVTNGKTRDSQEVASIQLPVFAAGITCQDVRKRAVVQSMNQKIFLQDVCVMPGDLIIADAEGVVVIPQAMEEKILELAAEKVANENAIVRDILNDVMPPAIIEARGAF